MNKMTVLEVSYEIKNPPRNEIIHPVIVEDDENLCLIDCGFTGSFSLLKKEVEKHNINFAKLNKVIITHHDHDHMGALAEIKRHYPDISVISSKIEKTYISGEKKSLRLQQIEDKYNSLDENQKKEKEELGEFLKLLKALEKVSVDKTVEDKEVLDICGGIEIVSTPGHMPGHISVYLKEFKTLITGDALTAENNILQMASPRFSFDMKEAKKSAEKLLDYNIEKVVCYHGGICKGNIKKSLENLVKN